MRRLNMWTLARSEEECINLRENLPPTTLAHPAIIPSSDEGHSSGAPVSLEAVCQGLYCRIFNLSVAITHCSISAVHPDWPRLQLL